MFYLRDVKKQDYGTNEFDNRFVKQRDNDQHDETDFIAQPFIPSVKRRLDNLHAMYLGDNVIRNITKQYPKSKGSKKIGFEGKLL